MQLRASGGQKVLQQIRQHLARDEKVAAALGHIDISNRLALHAAAHQRAEKIPVRERIALEIGCADGGDRPVLALQPALVQIVRQIAADLALSHGRPAVKPDVLPAQQLGGKHLLPFGQKAR